MPIPKPNAGEKQDAFISRCMGSDDLKRDFPDEKQRSAVCFKSFRESYESGSHNLTEDFTEIVEQESVTIREEMDDRGNITHVIEGAVLLSELSKNKGPSGKFRRYPRTTQAESLAEFEDIEINVNHDRMNKGPRSVLEKIGKAVNIKLRTINREGRDITQTIGNLRLIDVEASRHIVKLVELDPRLSALSIVAQGDFKIGEEFDDVVGLKVKSVDIVTRGGTTRGFFEALHADDENKDKDKDKKKDDENTGHKDNASSPSESSDKITAEANSFTDAAGLKSDSESHLEAMFAHYRAAGNLYFAGDLNRARAHVEKASDHETVAKNLAKQEPDAQGSQFPDMQNKGNVPPKPVEGDAQWVPALYENRPADWVESVYK